MRKSRSIATSPWGDRWMYSSMKHTPSRPKRHSIRSRNRVWCLWRTCNTHLPRAPKSLVSHFSGLSYSFPLGNSTYFRFLASEARKDALVSRLPTFGHTNSSCTSSLLLLRAALTYKLQHRSHQWPPRLIRPMANGSLQPHEVQSKRPKSFLHLTGTLPESLPNTPGKSCPAVASALELPDPTAAHCHTFWTRMWSAMGPKYMTTWSLDRTGVLSSVGPDLLSSTIKRHGITPLTMTSWLNRRETISMASCKNPFAAGRTPGLLPKEFGRAVGLPFGLFSFFAFSAFLFSPIEILDRWAGVNASSRHTLWSHPRHYLQLRQDRVYAAVNIKKVKGGQNTNQISSHGLYVRLPPSYWRCPQYRCWEFPTISTSVFATYTIHRNIAVESVE